MIIKRNSVSEKRVMDMNIKEYPINPDFSGALVELEGIHGMIKCLGEDRIYFIVEGEGEFILKGVSTSVAKEDMIFVPKNTPYNIKGKMKYLVICSPEFKSEDDVLLD